MYKNLLLLLSIFFIAPVHAMKRNREVTFDLTSVFKNEMLDFFAYKAKQAKLEAEKIAAENFNLTQQYQDKQKERCLKPLDS